MKLAEALVTRSDLNKKLGELRSRISENLITSSDQPAAEDANVLLAQADDVADQLEKLIRAINATNMSTAFAGPHGDGTLTDALARRDLLAMKHKTLTEALSGTSRRGRWYNDTNTGALTVDVAALRDRADQLARDLRQLDLAIQQANWATDLVDI